MFLTFILQNKFWLFPSRSNEEQGQGLVEYALIILLMAIAVIAALMLFGVEVRVLYNDITSELTGINP